MSRSCECPNCGYAWEEGIDRDWSKRMREARVSKGLSLRAIGIALDLSAVYISEMEKSTRNMPRIEIRHKWEQLLGIAT